MRRPLIVLVLLVIVGGIAWWLFHWQSTPGRVGDPWNALPPDAAVIIEVPAPITTWQRTTGHGPFAGGLSALPGGAVLAAVMDRLTQAATKDPDLVAPLDAHPLLLVAGPAAEDIDLLLMWPLGADGEAWDALQEALATEGRSAPSLEEGARAALHMDSTALSIDVAVEQGILFVGTSKTLVDDACKRLRRPAAAPDTLFIRARRTFGGSSDAHLLVRPSGLVRMLHTAFLPEALASVEAPEGWVALDVRLRPNTLLMNGLLFTASPQPWLEAIAHQPVSKPAVTRVLPADIGWLRTLQVGDARRCITDLRGEAPPDTLFDAYASWVEGTIGVAAARTEQDTIAHHWAVFQSSDPAAATAGLLKRPMADSSTYRGVRTARLADSGVLERLWGPAFAPLSTPWWAVLTDKVVFAGTPGDLRAAIDAWTDGTSLALAPRTGELFQHYATGSAASWWCDGTGSQPLWRSALRADRSAFGEHWQALWRDGGACLLELVPQSPGTFEVTFCMQRAPAATGSSGTLWSAAIGAPLENPPFLVKDHLSRTLQVLAQDRDHRISLISCTGKVLWQRELEGPIMGEVQQVDRFKNGKLQLLFNTADRIHLIDRNGQDVAPFPLALPAKASAPLSVLDYEGNRAYRLLLPTVDGRLLNYSAEGKPVDGWSPTPFAAPVIRPVQHVRAQMQDHLLVLCADGRLLVMDRRGGMRPDARRELGSGSVLLGLRAEPGAGLCRITWRDSLGTVLTSTLSGAADTLALPMDGEVSVLDVDGDGTDELVRTRRDSLFIQRGRALVAAVALPEAPASPAFGVPITGAAPAIGLVLPEREQVRILTATGEPWPGSPWKGIEPCRVADINVDGRLDLVTATKDGHVIAYTLP